MAAARININEELMQQLEDKGQECEVSRDWLVSEGLNLMANIDASLLVRIRFFADGLGIEPWLVIQNILISEWARNAARIKVNGHDPARLLLEFSRDVYLDGTEKVKTGDDLFNTLFEIYKRQFTLERQDRELRLREQAAKHPELQTPPKFDDIGYVPSVEEASRRHTLDLIEKLPPAMADAALRDLKKTEEERAKLLQQNP
jgi:hypothetical protein